MNPLVFLPIGSVTLSVLLILILDLIFKRKEYLGYASILLILLTAFLNLYFLFDKELFYQGELLLLNNFSVFSIFLSFFIVLLIFLISIHYTSNHTSSFEGYYPLLLFALSGMVVMVSSLNLLVIFLGLEILSLSSYALSAIDKKNIASTEAGVKYFLLGAFSSAFLIFGVMIILAEGNVDFSNPLSIIGMGFIFVGFAFKLSLVPFHAWTPDVYEGSPSPSTTFFSLGPKIAGFIVLLRIFQKYFQAELPLSLSKSLWLISALSMILGNLTALKQTNLKRMLAYSSIAHSGYILMGFLSIGKGGEKWIFFYLLSYLFINGGAFASLTVLMRDGKEFVELKDISGLSKRSPWLSAFFSLFLVSLAGFPPTAGFLAKFYIFSHAIQNGFFWLTFIAIVTTLLSVFYYLRVIIYMYMKDEEGEGIGFLSFPLVIALFIFAFGAIYLGIFPKHALFFILKAIGSTG
ncbi:MAG: NADH-quinone oxidoreductase subunit N [Candidatus Aminicenantia bacterium]